MGYVENIRKKIGHDAIFMPAATCAIIKNKKILLQRRSDDNTWALHGGALELGEDFLDAVLREVKEELSIDIIKPKFIKVYSGSKMYHKYPNGDIVYSILALFLVNDYVGEIKIDNKEVLDVKWFSLDTIPDNIIETDKILINDIKEYL